MPKYNARTQHFARTGAAQAAGRHAKTVREQRDQLRTALGEILDRFTEAGGGQHTAAATTEDVERWRALLDDPKEPPTMAIDLNTRREAYAAWLTANQITPGDVPCDDEFTPEGLTLATRADGARVIRYAALLRNERGHKYHDPETNDAAKEQRETLLIVPPPAGLHVPEES